jgi:peroxiredoxin
MRSLLVGLLVIVSTPEAADDTPRSQYEALITDFKTRSEAAKGAYSRAATDEGRRLAITERPNPQQFAPRFFALAEKYPQDEAAIDSLIWIASRCSLGVLGEEALWILARDHRRSERLKEFCGKNNRYGVPFWPYEQMLRAVLKDTPHRDVRARACLSLAVYLHMAKETTEKQMVIDSTLLARPSASREDFSRIQKRGLDKVAAESAALFEEVIERYADVQIENSYPPNVAELAKEQLFELRNLSIGAKAPEIDGHNAQGAAMKLSDYRGKIVVLDFGSHRSCGVCRQMYPDLRDFVRDYRGKPVALLGISVDDDPKELRALAEKGETTWPIWADGENKEGPIASLWVIHFMPTIYVLDHKGVIRNKGFLQPDEICATVDFLLEELNPSKTLDPSSVPARDNAVPKP